MKLAYLLASALSVSGVLAWPTTTTSPNGLAVRADSSLVGYLGIFFLGNEPDVYFYLSNGNDAVSFTALNGGDPIIVPTLGTGGVRDPSIIKGGGDEAGNKWYIIGTDLDIAKTTWDASERNGSLGILIWESTDLINWTGERLVNVEDDTAGMVWAPDAIWDADKGQYLVHWASKFYATSDPSHSGDSTGPIVIRYAYTSDFKTFTAPSTFISESWSVIDLAILALGDSISKSYLRFLKNEDETYVYQERSDNGLFGPWTDMTTIQSSVEGPYAYLDNVTPDKATLLLDYFGGNGYQPFQSTGLDGSDMPVWTAANKTAFPTELRHGSVLGVTSDQYAALAAKWR